VGYRVVDSGMCGEVNVYFLCDIVLFRYGIIRLSRREDIQGHCMPHVNRKEKDNPQHHRSF